MVDMILRYIIAIVVAYLLGSLSSATIVSKIAIKKDIRELGSGNAGTTNALRVMGWSKTVFVLLGDILKNVIAMLLVRPIMGEYDPSLALVFAGIACVLGHTFPIFFGFRGGKGVLSTATVAMFVDWRVSLIAILVFVIVVVITKYVSLGSVIAVCTAPIQFALYNGGINAESAKYVFFGAFLAILVTTLHHANIGRLIAGTESKIKFKK